MSYALHLNKRTPERSSVQTRQRSVRDQSASDLSGIVQQETAKRDAAIQQFQDSINTLVSVRDEALSLAQSGAPGSEEYQSVADAAEDLIGDLSYRL